MRIAVETRLLIRGVDYGRYVDRESVSATSNVNPRQDNMKFSLWLDGELDPPRAGMEVVWGVFDVTSGAELSREYAGIVTTVSERDEGGALVYDCTAQPYNRWFDRKLVKGFTQQDKAENVIKQLVTKYAPEFDTSLVNAPPVVVSQHFNYQRMSKAMTMLCDQIGYGWYIDYYKKLHVYRNEEFNAPLPGSGSQVILDVDGDYENYGDLVLTEDSEEVYNKMTIRGFKVRGPEPIEFRFVADGQSNQWTMGYRISSAKGDIKVYIDDTPYTVKRDILEGIPGQGGDPTVAYVHYTQHLVRFAFTPSAGSIIRVVAYPLNDRVYGNIDTRSVAYMKSLENFGDGVYEYAELDKSLTQSTMQSVYAKVEGLFRKHGLPIISGTFTSFTSGWRAGQSFAMYSSRRMGGILDPQSPNYRSDIKRFYVYRVTKRWLQNAHPNATATWNSTPIQYTIEFADRPNLV